MNFIFRATWWYIEKFDTIKVSCWIVFIIFNKIFCVSCSCIEVPLKDNITVFTFNCFNITWQIFNFFTDWSRVVLSDSKYSAILVFAKTAIPPDAQFAFLIFFYDFYKKLLWKRVYLAHPKLHHKFVFWKYLEYQIYLFQRGNLGSSIHSQQYEKGAPEYSNKKFLLMY